MKMLSRGGEVALVLLGAASVLYAAISAWAFFRADSIIYQPPPPSYTSSLEGLVRIRSSDGVELAAVWLPNPKATFTLLYFHGNACDLGQESPFLHELRDRGFSILAYDYRGYGLSGGSPSEDALYRDGQVLLDWLKEKGIASKRVIAYGRSLGGGVATELADNNALGGLTLESTFTSAFRVLTGKRLLPFDRFNNIAKLPRLRCPVLVMHGTADSVIPFSHGEQLFRAANEPKTFLRAEGAEHYAVPDVAGERYWETLQAFARRCAEAR